MSAIVALLLESLAGIIILVFLVLTLGFVRLRVFRQYEEGVYFFLGKFDKVKKAGLRIQIKFIQEFERVDLRTVPIDVPTQDVITLDNVSVKVNAVIYMTVKDSKKAVMNVSDFQQAANLLGQTTLRSVVGSHELDELLSQRDKINSELRQILDDGTDEWGVYVNKVEVKAVDLDEIMIRAIAKQAEAERIRRAKVINADGELEASEKLSQAAEKLSNTPGGMELRWMQTVRETAGVGSHLHVFPGFNVPIIDATNHFAAKHNE